MKSPDVIIVGAGLAGLSCGFELAEKGKKVLILEAEKVVGGRTASWDENGMLVESGLHRFLGFYSALPDLMKKASVDIDKAIIWEDEIEIVTPDNGPRAVFGASPLGKPLETFLSALGNNDFLPPEDKASFVKLVTIGLKDFYANAEELDELTVTEYAIKHNISSVVVDRILKAFTEGLLFYPIRDFSAYAMMNFLGPYLHKSIRFGVGAFAGGMTEVMTGPITAAIERMGGVVRTDCPVDSLIVEDSVVKGVLVKSEKIEAQSVVIATEVASAQKFLKNTFPDHTFTQSFLKLRSMPAVTIQLDLSEPAWPVDRVIFAPGTVLASSSEQSRTTFRHVPGRLSIDLAPSNELIDREDEWIYHKTITDAKRLDIDLKKLCRQYRVIRHPSDFYEPSTGMDKWRPEQKTPIPGLTLTGDYTKQLNPSTMEGAVISGQKAAEAVLENL